MLVTTEHLSIGYRNYIVQSNLNLVVENGDLICMLGTNGCGKSTLLRTLAGLQPSLAGKVLLQGQSLDDLSSQQKAKLFALVLTDPVEAKNMTVYDVIALGRYPYSSWLGNLSEEDKHFIQRALLQVKLQHKTFSRISELSDGERQRIMIARALAQDTPLILLDEPTAHLDLPNRVDTMLFLRRLAHETGKAVVLSTHELDLALQTADKLWLMSPQKGMYCGLPEDLVLSGAFQEVFASQSFFFNPANGNFSVSYDTYKPVHVYGDKMRVYWTVRALARLGYCGEEKADTSVEVSAGKWILNHSKVCSSIEELSHELSLLKFKTE